MYNICRQYIEYSTKYFFKSKLDLYKLLMFARTNYNEIECCTLCIIRIVLVLSTDLYTRYLQTNLIQILNRIITVINGY